MADSPVLLVSRWVADQQDKLNRDILSATNRSKLTPEGKASLNLLPRFTTPSFGRLFSNPILNLGSDFISGKITTSMQGMLAKVLKQDIASIGKSSSPTDKFMGVLALASTANTEVALELARANARLIVSQIEKKDAVTKKMIEEIDALRKAMGIVLNSRPFFDEYFERVLAAYLKIGRSNQQLRSIVSAYKKEPYVFRRVQFERSLVELDAALDLMLPDPDAKVDEVRDRSMTGKLANLPNITNLKTAKDALAAALLIPTITGQIAVLFAQYAVLTIEINALIFTFLNSLDTYTASFSKSEAIRNTVIDHINAGADDLDDLLADMGTILFPTDNRQSQPGYPVQVVSSASLWSIRLTAAINWLRQAPVSSASMLDKTGESVIRYQAAVSALRAQGNVRSGFATLEAESAQEKITKTERQLTALLVAANTVVATRQIPDEVRQRIAHLEDLFEASVLLDTRIKTALQPFIDTPGDLVSDARSVLSDLRNLASNLGLDRARELLNKGDVGGILGMTAQTATFVGAAGTGLRYIIKQLKSSPTATDSDQISAQNAADQISRSENEKRAESTRSSSSGMSAFIDRTKQKIRKIAKLGAESLEVAKKNSIDLSRDVAGGFVGGAADAFEGDRIQGKVGSYIKGGLKNFT